MISKIGESSVYDIMIRMFVLIFIIGWCMLLMYPFVSIILWSFILALALFPVHQKLSKKLGNRPKLASAILVFTILIIVILPSALLTNTLVGEVKELKQSYDAGLITLLQPNEKIKEWPVIGERVYDTWLHANKNFEQLFVKYQEEITDIIGKIAKGVLGAIGGIIQIIISLLIAGVLLIFKDTGESIRKFFRKIVGTNGDYFADVVKKTVGNVVKGVLGVAMIQASVCGIGFLLADIPYAGIWTILVLILAILQISPLLVTIPVMFYMFTIKEPLPSVLWSVYLFLAGLLDNVLKPILLGKGAPVPMLIIYIGVIGGFIYSGFIGLFTGAIVLSIGYKLLTSWINSDNKVIVDSIGK